MDQYHAVASAGPITVHFTRAAIDVLYGRCNDLRKRVGTGRSEDYGPPAVPRAPKCGDARNRSKGLRDGLTWPPLHISIVRASLTRYSHSTQASGSIEV